MESVVKVLENNQWTLANFQDCELGDKRRTNRLLSVAENMLAAPEKSLPAQSCDWSDLKAAYRFFDCDQVTFEAICKPHFEQTLACKPGVYLLISDTTDCDFTRHGATQGLGMLGDGKGRGIQMHPCLMYDLQEKQVVGLAGSLLHYRTLKKQAETRTQIQARRRESCIWGEIVDQVGKAPEGSQWIHVFDRGGDNFEAMCHVKLSGNDWVIRASHLNRNVQDSAGNPVKLSEMFTNAKTLGTFSMELRSTPKHAARTAHLKVSSCEVIFEAPARKSPWLRACKVKQLHVTVVTAEEIDPPQGNQPIRWVILTSLKVKTFDDAWKILGYYEHRWMIEEYNRVCKSGCSIEKHALRAADRLEPLLGLISIVAVRLFQLKLIGRNQPEAKASARVPSSWLTSLKHLCPRLKITEMTVYSFFRELAKLGGFLGRKHDGEPGWITIWRGYQKLHMISIGIAIADSRKGNKCG